MSSVWDSIVGRRARSLGFGAQEEEPQFIELSDDDCKLLLAAGLKVQKGASPSDLYCFQYLPSYYDGTPLQVLRLLEEVRAAGRLVHKQQDQQQVKRQRVQGEFSGRHTTMATTTKASIWKNSKFMELDVEALEQDEGELLELIKIKPASLVKGAAGSPIKGAIAAMGKYVSPVKALATLVKSPSPHRTSTPVTTRMSKRTSMKIDVGSEQDGDAETSLAANESGKKRKSESSSPLAALFTPRSSIKTPSPGIKTRRSSVLQQFETPEQPTQSSTPQTSPAPPKRFSMTYTETTTTTSEWMSDETESSDGLVDDDVEDDSRACCDYKSVVEPVWDALQRTSSRFHSIWEEVRGLSSSLVLIPVSSAGAEPSFHVADGRVDDVDLLVYEGESDEEEEDDRASQLNNTQTKSMGVRGFGVRTRRQRKGCRLSPASTWRLW